MARKTKYTSDMVQQIVKLLEDGNTDTDTCALVGLNKDTFYTWIGKKSDFSDAVTHARGIARQRAVDAYRGAMKESSEKTAKTETFTEIRLNRQGEPYEYKRVKTEQSVTVHAPDWRAAESYLKRRDPEHWAETFVIKVTPDQAALLKKHGFTSPSEAFAEMLNEFASADAEHSAD